MIKVEIGETFHGERYPVPTRIEADDPLYSRRNDTRLPLIQYEDGEEYIYYDQTYFDRDFVLKDEDDVHILYTREAFEYCCLGIGRASRKLTLVGLDREKPVRNVVHANLWEKMRAQANERLDALEAGVDFDHLPGMPWIGPIPEETN